MSVALIKNAIKRNWKLLLIFAGVLCFYLAVIISLIDPEDMEQVKEIFNFKGNLLSAFGISVEAMTDPLSYTASTFFSLLVMAFTMVFYIIQGNRLVAKPVDNNSLAYTLSMPVSRTKFIVIQAGYLLGSLAVLFIGILATGGIALAVHGNFHFARYLNLVTLTFLLNAVMAMLSFTLSVSFCDSKKGFALGTGVPIALLLISMLGGAVGDKAAWLSKISPFGWLDAVGIVNGRVGVWWMYIAFIAAAGLLFVLSVVIFKRKRLPL